MVTITLPSELERVVTEEAMQNGTTAQRLALDVLQESFLTPSSVRQLSGGATLAKALASYLRAVNTRNEFPEGLAHPENDARKFAQFILRDLIAVTYDWPKTNRRRGRLIRREIDGTITAEEARELKQLQALADLRTDLFDPIKIEDLERLRAEIANGTNE